MRHLHSLTVTALVLALTIPYAPASGARPEQDHDLKVRVVDAANLGIRVLVRVNAEGQRENFGYTDWTGWVSFHALVPAKYKLDIEINGQQLRSEIVKVKNQSVTTTTVRLKNVSFSERLATASIEELSMPSDAYEYYVSGIRFMRGGKLESAVDKLERAISIYPRHSKSYNALGVVLHLRSMHKEAENAFRGAIALEPRFTEARLNLGKLLIELNRTAEGRSELQQAFDSDPNNGDALELLLASMLSAHDELSADRLAHSLHQRGIVHPNRIHTEVGTALAAHSFVQLAAEQYAVLLKEDRVSEDERATAEATLSTFDRSPESAIRDAKAFHPVDDTP